MCLKKSENRDVGTNDRLIFKLFALFSITLIPNAVAYVAPPLDKVVVVEEKVEQPLNVRIEALATKYGVDVSVVNRIIKCESSFKENAVNKNIKDGVHWSTDFGYFQVNDFFHEKEMIKMGLDIHTPNDNLEYGFYLLQRDGTRHWKASSKCWNL